MFVLVASLLAAVVAQLGHSDSASSTPIDVRADMSLKAECEVNPRGRRYRRGKSGKPSLWVHVDVSKHQRRRGGVKMDHQREEGGLSPTCENHRGHLLRSTVFFASISSQWPAEGKHKDTRGARAKAQGDG